MGGFLAFVSFFVFAWAVVGLIAPQRVGLKKRVHAVGLWAASVLLAIVAGGLLEETSPPSSTTAPAQRLSQAERLERQSQTAAQSEAERLARLEDNPAPTTTASRAPRSTWSSIRFTNEWGETSGKGAQSEAARPARPMSFPYGGVTGRIMVSCRSIWLRFSEEPNLTGGDIHDGYHEHSLGARIDGNDLRLRVTQDWGSEDILIRTSGFRS